MRNKSGGGGGGGAFVTLSLIFGFSSMIIGAEAIRFHLRPNSVKCLKEEIQANVLVTGEYEVSESMYTTVEYSVKDMKGHVLSRKENIPFGRLLKFSFVTETYDIFEICFACHATADAFSADQLKTAQEVFLVTKRGVEAKSYASIGEAANLKPVEVELQRLEDLSEAIVQDFVRMRQNEEEMRDTNEATNTRVLFLSNFSMCWLLAVSTWQVLYLRRFFKAKKLIE